MLIDDHLPYHKIDRKNINVFIEENLAFNPTENLIFGRSFKKTLWVSLLEKAWAKVVGAYYKISLGSPSEGFLTMTDLPIESLKHKNFKNTTDFLKIIRDLKYKYKNTLMSSIIQLKGKKSEQYRKIGLITNHCYSVLEINEIVYNKNTIKYVLLRNPHGYNNYCGNYSISKNDFWNDDLKNLMNFDKIDNGSFYMPMEDYLKLFDYTFVCLNNNEDYIYESFKLSKNLLINEEEEKICLNRPDYELDMKRVNFLDINENEGFKKLTIEEIDKFQSEKENFKIVKDLKLDNPVSEIGNFLILENKEEDKNIYLSVHPKMKRISNKPIKNRVNQLMICKTNFENIPNSINDFNNIKLEYLNSKSHNRGITINIKLSKGIFLLYTSVNYGITHKKGYIIGMNIILNPDDKNKHTQNEIDLYLMDFLSNKSTSNKENSNVYKFRINLLERIIFSQIEKENFQKDFYLSDLNSKGINSNDSNRKKENLNPSIEGNSKAKKILSNNTSNKNSSSIQTTKGIQSKNNDPFKLLDSFKLVNLNDFKSGFGVIIIKNSSNSTKIISNITIKQFHNLKFISKFKIVELDLNEALINNNDENYQKIKRINFDTISENNFDFSKMKFDEEFYFTLNSDINNFTFILFKKEKMECGFKIAFSEKFSQLNQSMKSKKNLKSK